MKKKRSFPTFILIFLIGIVLAFAGSLIQDQYMGRVLVLMAINAILGSSINLLAGFSGQISLAHAAFYGLGAYTTAILTQRLGLSFWAALPCSFCIAAAFGILLGIPTLKLKGHYLTIATLAFNMIIYMVIKNWDGLTNGTVGMFGIQAPTIFGIQLNSPEKMLPFVIIVCTLVVAFIVSLMKSSYGRAFAAIKVDEISAEVSGVSTYYYKVLLFAISSGIAGIAGSIYASYNSFITPETFTLNASIKILTICVVGGIGTIIGPLVGTGFISLVSEYFRNFADLEQVIYGAMLVLVIVLMPRGIYPTVLKWIRGGISRCKSLSEKRKERRRAVE